jgi:hypothetical protein
MIPEIISYRPLNVPGLDDVFQHVGRICIDPEGASFFQFGLAVAPSRGEDQTGTAQRISPSHGCPECLNVPHRWVPEGVALRSEDCASNPEFEKLLQNIRGSSLIEEDEWRRYG